MACAGIFFQDANQFVKIVAKINLWNALENFLTIIDTD